MVINVNFIPDFFFSKEFFCWYCCTMMWNALTKITTLFLASAAATGILADPHEHVKVIASFSNIFFLILTFSISSNLSTLPPTKTLRPPFSFKKRTGIDLDAPEKLTSGQSWSYLTHSLLPCTTFTNGIRQ